MENQTLDAIVTSIIEGNAFGASTLNALHGVKSNHPWCKGKSLEQRKEEAIFALAGRVYPYDLKKIGSAI